MDPKGLELASRLPELAGLAVRVAARSAVLDGELVVVDATGRADPAELERRLAGEGGRAVAFLAFDLLDLDGRPLLSMPLERRRDQLRRVLRPGDEVLAVPAIPGEGRALFAAVAAQGLAGILARQRTSPYLPGIRSRLWRFVPAHAGGKRARAQARRDAAAAAGALGRGRAPRRPKTANWSPLSSTARSRSMPRETASASPRVCRVAMSCGTGRGLKPRKAGWLSGEKSCTIRKPLRPSAT